MSFISSLKQALIFFHTTDVDHSSQGHKQVMPLEQNCKWESLKREKTTTSLSGKGWSFSFEIHKNVKMLTPCTHARFWSTRGGLLGRLVQHFHIGHNAPGLPPKVYITIVFNFSWDACNTNRGLFCLSMRDRWTSDVHGGSPQGLPSSKWRVSKLS